MKIQSSDDQIANVEIVSGHFVCHECGDNRCEHSQMVREYVTRKFHKYRFDVTSAFHKEIRRSDRHLGRTWALILRKTQGATRIRDYCRGICLEETRNVKLYDILYNKWSEFDRIDLADMLISSKKRWMAPVEYDCFFQQVRGYVKQAGKNNQYSLDKIRETLHNTYDLSEWYACAFSAINYDKGSEFKTGERFFWETVGELVKDGKAKNEKWVQKMLDIPSRPFHATMALCEIASGHWDESMNEINNDWYCYQKPDYIPKFEDYVYDCHSYIGKGRLLENWFRIAPGLALPPQIDLRWSGMMPGLSWRFEAYRYAMENHIDEDEYRHIKWEDVPIRCDLWKSATRLDVWFYKRFYGMAYVKHRQQNSADFKRFLEDTDDSPKLLKPYERKK